MAMVKCKLHLNQDNTLPALLQSSILKQLDNLLPPISLQCFRSWWRWNCGCSHVWLCGDVARGWGEEASAIIEVIRADNTLGISRYRSLLHYPVLLTSTLTVIPSADHPARGKIVPGFPLLCEWLLLTQGPVDHPSFIYPLLKHDLCLCSTYKLQIRTKYVCP